MKSRQRPLGKRSFAWDRLGLRKVKLELTLLDKVRRSEIPKIFSGNVVSKGVVTFGGRSEASTLNSGRKSAGKEFYIDNSQEHQAQADTLNRSFLRDPEPITHACAYHTACC